MADTIKNLFVETCELILAHHLKILRQSCLLKMIAQRKFLILAIVCMAFSFFSFMALVQVEPLSFAVPASAASFILETVLAKLVLKENVGLKRAVGALIVLAGVAMLGG